ncbi:hypothetical protein ACFO5R_14325 [Halosolutus amylolyticus]|uniref:Enamine deaminase RidA, house cleaning of reactive enamine intermediates, YjgF/YER057c/UK114 family n=1 Tax=Halosolutus amylolyticus TaxID=2932267 RepID=A0ABD5PRC9_9EURY|nr:hypothetical protein [Halosolutus amylolyticus]
MEKTVFRREDRGDDAVAATAVRTRHGDHDRVQLDGVVGPGDTPREQADRVLSFADRFLREYCDGRLADVTMIRHYVREDLLPEAETEIGAACRSHFDPPELPTTVMVGVSDVVGGDRAVKIEMEATIPHDRAETTVVELPPSPGYVTSEDQPD